MTNLEKAESLLNMLVESNPDHAERLLESMLAKIELRKRLATKRAQAEPVAWLRVIDEAMVVHHLGVADPTDDYETAKRKMNTLLCMAQDIGADFAKQAEPVQEPVAWGCFKGGELQSELIGTKADADFWVASDEPHMQGMVAGPLYTAPLQRKPLTEEEIYEMYNEPRSDAEMVEFARAIERAHGIKEAK